MFTTKFKKIIARRLDLIKISEIECFEQFLNFYLKKKYLYLQRCMIVSNSNH